MPEYNRGEDAAVTSAFQDSASLDAMDTPAAPLSEREVLRSEIDALKTEAQQNLRLKVGVELGLPEEFAKLIRGTDEASMRQDAQEISEVLKTHADQVKFENRLASRPRGAVAVHQPISENPNMMPGGRKFYASQLKDPEFFAAHQVDIYQAVRAGRFIDDLGEPGWKLS